MEAAEFFSPRAQCSATNLTTAEDKDNVPIVEHRLFTKRSTARIPICSVVISLVRIATEAIVIKFVVMACKMK